MPNDTEATNEEDNDMKKDQLEVKKERKQQNQTNAKGAMEELGTKCAMTWKKTSSQILC